MAHTETTTGSENAAPDEMRGDGQSNTSVTTTGQAQSQKQQNKDKKNEDKHKEKENDEDENGTQEEKKKEKDEIDTWLNKIKEGKKGDKRHKQCLEWDIDEYSTFSQLSKSKKFKNEKVMRSSLDPNEEHEPLIAALIDVLEPHWKKYSQSDGM